MTTIKLATNLTLARVAQGVVFQLGLSHVALRQGSLDGACGPYALMMALVVSGGMSFDEAVNIWSHQPHGNSRLARQQAKLGALVQNGVNAENLQELFQAIRRRASPSLLDDIQLEVIANDNEILSGIELLREICNHIDATGMPVILGMDWAARDGGGAHWVVAVGYEGGEREIKHIVLLDPAAETETTSLWNAVLTGPVQRGKRPYLTWDNSHEPQQCSIPIALAIKKDTAKVQN